MANRGGLAVWRGSAGTDVGRHGLGQGDTDADPQRIVLLMRHDQNRAHVRHQLEQHYTVFEPHSGRLAPGTFDLAVTDLAGLKNWWSLLLDAKFYAEPTFLPVVLILSRPDLKRHVSTLWDVVDELITAPIDRREFDARVAMLLHTRDLALTQRDHLAYVVNHDRATGLPNRVLFMARLHDAVRDASILGEHAHLTAVRLPLERVLKSMGHRGMDAVATMLASRLAAFAGEEASVARLTTEEWGILYRSGVPLSGVLDVLNSIRSLGDTPFTVGEESVRLAPRIGVAVYPLDATDSSSWLDRAMAALASADSTEPVFYAREVQDVALRALRTESQLHKALDGKQFELHYQPQVAMETREVTGVEALIRWRLPGGELVPPAQFLQVAEDTGLIRPIDAWVLAAACRTMRAWLDDGVDVGHMSVNVCAQDIADEGFVETVREALADAALPAERLEIEVTETDLVRAEAGDDDGLRTLQAEGVHIAIDDFGTGYSSLAYLHALPATTLKIDRSFVRDVLTNDKHRDLVDAMIWLAGRFGLKTVAEGVESEEVAVYLASRGITRAQGFHYGRPMPEATFRTWLDG